MSWSPLEDLVRQICMEGGFINAHAHYDRAYTVTPAMMHKTKDHLFSKWQYVDNFKRNATIEDYLKNFDLVMNHQQFLNVQAALSFVDIDPICEYNAITAAKLAKERHKDFKLLIASQTLKGVIDHTARGMIEDVLDDIDIIGGLPGKDKGKEPEHLDILMGWAKQTGKRVHVHVDQLNSPLEKETELLARKTIEHGLEGRVTAIHSISLACHPKSYRDEVYKICKDAALSFVTCPSAWIDHQRTEKLMPWHNAITPVDELLENYLTVALGTDNICDVYKPFCDGDPVNELRLLIDACKIYDTETLLEIAVFNGREVLGLFDNMVGENII